MELLQSGTFLLFSLFDLPYLFGVIYQFEFFENFRVDAGCFLLEELCVLQEVFLTLAKHHFLLFHLFLSFCHLLDAVDGHLLLQFG